MTAAVEILVPQPVLPAVKKALGPLPATTFHTHPSHGAGQRLIVSPIDVLGTASGRAALENLVRSASRKDGVSLVLFAIAGAALGFLVAEALTRVAWQAREEPFIAPSPEPVRRIVFARRMRAEKELIASASLEDGKLVVWSCEPRRFEVAVSDIPVLARLDADTLKRFELSESGSRIRWPQADVDLNLDTIREYADPDVRREHEGRARQEAARYADAIRRLREERGLKQSDIEGLTERQVRRLEHGDTVPQIETLRRLAAAHGMAVDDYLRELAKRSRKPARRLPNSKPGRAADAR